MKLAFVNMTSNPSKGKHPTHPLPPLDIGYCSALLKKKEIEVKFYDIAIDSPCLKDINKFIADSNPDYVFMKIGISSLDLFEKIMESIKTPVVLFGPLATFSPNAFENKEEIYFIQGEIEASILDFIKNPKKYRKPKRSIKIVKDLASLPLIDYSIFRDKEYRFFYFTGLKKRLNFAFLQSSRGCPYNCIFCTPLERNSMGKEWRGKKPEKIASEVEQLKNMGYNFIYFVDDLFTFDKRRTLEICSLLKELNVNWGVQTRVDRMDEEIVDTMISSGCTTICLGIESGSDRILKILRKGFVVKDILRASKFLLKKKVNLIAFVMLGNPTETKEEMEMTYQLIKKVNPNLFQIAFFTPFPGSPCYEKYKIDPKKIKSRHEIPTKEFSEICVNDLIKIRKRFYKNFYMNPKTIFRFLRKNFISVLINLPVYFRLFKKTMYFFIS